MGDFVFNVAKGQVNAYHERVNNNDPANSALIVVLLASTGLETDAVLRDKTTLADVVSGATNEATNTGVARKVLTDADIAAINIDQANDRVDADITADQVWATVANDGTGGIGKLLVCYDPDTTGGTDANIIPLCAYDFVPTLPATPLTAQWNAAGYFRAA